MSATPVRTLRPEDQISHYRIVGPLGAGGMGEVYLAQDQKLGRNVALKVLPAELVRNEERVRRFVLEARSASSLSHPNIVTIHEIGQERVRTPGEPDSDPVHFISMELVSGKTLGTLIHEDRADLRTMLGWLAQAADGIAKAHAAGIVHRDLKPGNVMVTSDGFAKVLDFGLAKLTESAEAGPDTTSDPTRGQGATGAGAVVGTAGYMSPEQVRGKAVDHRSDVFSFGCILYEAATRRRAFAADSSVETMHKVLHEAPAPIEELNPKAPAELRRLVRRCLQKNPDQRLQSMKDVALELREIEAEYDSLSPSASSGSHAGLPAARGARARPPVWAAGAVLLALVAVAAWWFLGRGRTPAQPFLRMRMAAQTTTGDVGDAALSPDGRFLAWLTRKEGRSELKVRQVATGADVVVVPSTEGQITNPSFSPDGSYLFYSAPQQSNPRYFALYQVPSLGGTPREIAFDVDSRASASPDGRRITFFRHVIDTTQDRIMVMDLESRQERRLAVVEPPLTIAAGPVWSPDGKRIAAGLQDARANAPSTIAFFDPETGRRQDWARLDHTFLNAISWLPGPPALVASGLDARQSLSNQILLVGRNDAPPAPVTNDLNTYTAVSASLSEPLLAAVRTSFISNVAFVDLPGGELRRVTRASSPENSFLTISPGDSVSAIGTTTRDGFSQLCRIPADGSPPVVLTHDAFHSIRPQQGGNVVVLDRFDETGLHVWTCGGDGGSMRKLTSGAGEQVINLSPDGRLVVVRHVDDPSAASVVETATGRLVLRIAEFIGGGEFLDGGRALGVARATRDSTGLQVVVIEARPLDGGPPTTTFTPPAAALPPQPAPDGHSATYIDRADPHWNVFRQSDDGGPRKAVTHVTEGRVLQHRWSPDGRHLALVIRDGGETALWLADADGRQTQRVAVLSPETPGAVGWLPGGRQLVMGLTTQSSDAVLVRDFR